MNSLLFVYGSLKRDLQNHEVLASQNATFLAEVKTEPRYKKVQLTKNIPALVPGTESIEGELYEIDDAGLKRLDEFEGCPDMYLRSITTLDNGKIAWVYILNTAEYPEFVNMQG